MTTPGKCPFCGSEKVRINFAGLGASSKQHYAQCEDCTGDGPWGESEEDAIAQWNARSMPPEALRIPLQGSWPENDLRRAFVEGAKWWEWQMTGSTMFPDDVDRAESQAEKRYAPSPLRQIIIGVDKSTGDDYSSLPQRERSDA